jgi:hypothetical protein
MLLYQPSYYSNNGYNSYFILIFSSASNKSNQSEVTNKNNINKLLQTIMLSPRLLADSSSLPMIFDEPVDE